MVENVVEIKSNRFKTNFVKKAVNEVAADWNFKHTIAQNSLLLCAIMNITSSYETS